MQDREERSKGIEIHISDNYYQTDSTLQICETRSSEEVKLVRFLWQLISQSRCFTVSVQEQETNKFFIQVSNSVHG